MHAWLLEQAALDAKRKTARYMAEQGFFAERMGVKDRPLHWWSLPDGFNVQRQVVPPSWRPRVGRSFNDTDYFLHTRFTSVPTVVQKRIGHPSCDASSARKNLNRTRAELRAFAVGRCYLELS
jgi:hypothetical protein